MKRIATMVVLLAVVAAGGQADVDPFAGIPVSTDQAFGIFCGYHGQQLMAIIPYVENHWLRYRDQWIDENKRFMCLPPQFPIVIKPGDPPPPRFLVRPVIQDGAVLGPELDRFLAFVHAKMCGAGGPPVISFPVAPIPGVRVAVTATYECAAAPDAK